MRTIVEKRFFREAVLVLVLALAVPFLNGCSTLGIAKTDDLAAMEKRLQSSGSSTDKRVDTLEKSATETQQDLNQISANIDTLNPRFVRAKGWLETMNLDTIATDAHDASKVAQSAASNSNAFFTQYLEWVKAQHTLLEQQIKMLEDRINEDAKGVSKPSGSGDTSSEKPADSGGGG